MFLLALQASVQIKAAVCDYGNLRILLWLSIVLLPLLAALWILALLAVNDALDELHYAYSVTSLLCALYVFIGHCLVNRRVRYNIRITWLRLTRSGSRGSEESFTATRTSGVQNTPAHMVGGVAHGFMQPMDQLMGLEAEPSSSTTSRSNRGGGSGVGPTEDSVDQIDGIYYEGGKRDRHRRHRKCRRRRHRHRSKQAFGSETTGSSDDVSYDQSMELASSHSSDDDEDGPGRILDLQEKLRPSGPLLEQQMQQRGHSELIEQQKQNQINTLIRQSQHNSPSIYSTTQQQLKHSSSEQTNSSEAPTILYGQRLPTTTTEGSTTLQRSNILAMTAGLSEQCHASVAPLSASPAHSLHSIPSQVPSYGHYQHPISRPVPSVASAQLVEHIYSYARRPGQHYSTLGPRPAPDDSIGLPVVYNPENPYAMANPRPMPRSVLQASAAAAAVAGVTNGSTSPSGSGSSQSSHVRLISQSVDTSTNAAGVTSANFDR